MTPCSGLGEEEWKTRIIEDLERRGERREGGEKEEEKEEVLARVALSFDLMTMSAARAHHHLRTHTR